MGITVKMDTQIDKKTSARSPTEAIAENSQKGTKDGIRIGKKYNLCQ